MFTALARRLAGVGAKLLLRTYRMATRIRLRRVGRKGQAYYRIVVADQRFPRDGRFVATIGHYNPRTNPATINVNAEQARAWLGRGPSRRTRCARCCARRECWPNGPRSRAAAQAARAARGGGDPAPRGEPGTSLRSQDAALRGGR